MSHINVTQEKRADRAAEQKAVTPGRPATRNGSKADSPEIPMNDSALPSSHPQGFRDPLSLSGPGVIGNAVPLDSSISPRDEEMALETPSKSATHEPLEHALTSNPWDGTHTNQPAAGELESDPITQLSQASTSLLKYTTPAPITIDLPEAPPDPPPPALSSALREDLTSFEQDIYTHINWANERQRRIITTLEDIKRALRLLAPGISNVGSLMDKNGIFSLLLHNFTTRMDESIQRAETSTAAIFGRTDQIMNDLANVRRSCYDTMNVDANDTVIRTLTFRLDSIESSIAEIKRSIYQRQPDQHARTSQLPNPFQPPEPNMKTRPTIPVPHTATTNVPLTPAHQKKPADTMSIIEIQQELNSGTTGKNRKKTLTSQLTVRATLHPDTPAALELSIACTRVLDYL